MQDDRIVPGRAIENRAKSAGDRGKREFADPGLGRRLATGLTGRETNARDIRLAVDLDAEEVDVVPA